MFGTNDNPKNQGLKDLTKKEWATLVPIVIFIVWIGVFPRTFLNISENSSRRLVNKIMFIKTGIKPYMELEKAYPLPQFQSTPVKQEVKEMPKRSRLKE
jgi:NADH-quinone oxidoreductase subunit M